MGANQEIDQVALAGAVTKGSWLIPDAQTNPGHDRHGRCALHTPGRRGPVHLTIPLDVQEQRVDGGRFSILTPLQSHNLQGQTRASEAFR